ncbi:MAG: RagB/SusD family nutrient uptake outer membrane protein [Paludibacteraceae bacterium]|nr:RagB/SusD family nutrient uptake outer membrane protein [Paludibacteraceae bacterium]
MNKFLKIAVFVMAVVSLTACVHNLNTKPIDPNSSTSFNQDRMFTKCYSCMAVIGQSDPGGDSDVEDMDAGMSGFYRTIWYCNDLTTDEAFWIWDDPESRGLPTTDWTGSSDMIRGIYTRLNLNIKYCNHYLKYASRESEEDLNRIAEVRWIRAFHVFYLMDMYLYAPLITEESSEFPHFLPRHEIYEWLVTELQDVITLLPAQRVEKYRVGKAAAQLLLARVYLNADVYNKYNKEWVSGKTWQKAYDAATAVINDNPQHSLVTQKVVHDTTNFVYSAYQQLFMGDNHRDEVMKEAIFQIYQDGIYTQSHAGANFLIAGPRIGGMTAWGIEAEWHALRTSPTLIDKFLKPHKIDRATATEMIYNEFDMPAQLKDDRAIFCSDGMNTAEAINFNLTGAMGIGANSNFYESWAGVKFTSVYSTASLPKNSPRQSTSWADTDIPLLRFAEAYMIQAEALFRLGDKAGALAIINNTIRARANAIPLTSLDEETLLDEWSREFYFEGRRRIDLVRFGRFFGPESDMYRYHWEGRMGKPDAQPFVTGTPEYMNWFPVPSEDKRANPHYKIDVEGDVDNIFAAKGGDGYLY